MDSFGAEAFSAHAKEYVPPVQALAFEPVKSLRLVDISTGCRRTGRSSTTPINAICDRWSRNIRSDRIPKPDCLPAPPAGETRRSLRTGRVSAGALR